MIIQCSDIEEDWLRQLTLECEEMQRQREIDLDKERNWEIGRPGLEIEKEIIPYIAVSDWDVTKYLMEEK